MIAQAVIRLRLRIAGLCQKCPKCAHIPHGHSARVWERILRINQEMIPSEHLSAAHHLQHSGSVCALHFPSPVPLCNVNYQSCWGSPMWVNQARRQMRTHTDAHESKQTSHQTAVKDGSQPQANCRAHIRTQTWVDTLHAPGRTHQLRMRPVGPCLVCGWL